MHRRHDIAFKKAEECLDELNAATRMAAKRSIDTDGDGLADNGLRKQRAGAEMVRLDQRRVELHQIIDRPQPVLHRTDTGIGAINRQAHGDTVGDDVVGGIHPFERLLGHDRHEQAGSDFFQCGKIERVTVEDDGFHRCMHALTHLVGDMLCPISRFVLYPKNETPDADNRTDYTSFVPCLERIEITDGHRHPCPCRCHPQRTRNSPGGEGHGKAARQRQRCPETFRSRHCRSPCPARTGQPCADIGGAEPDGRSC